MITSLTILFFIFITGLVTGSFLNVVILRTVSEESIVFPGSKCPKCQNPLKWYHNIPILSYIFLRGKCAYCKEHISLQYPIVEFLTGCIFVGLFLRFCEPFDAFYGLNAINPISWVQFINYIFSIIVSCLFIIIAGTDIKEMKVSNAHLYSLISVGIIYSIIMASLNIIFYTKELGAPDINLNFFLTCPVFYSIGAAITGFIFMEILRKGTGKMLNIETFGNGDSYIAAGIGAVIGGLFGGFPPYSSFYSNLLILTLIFILSAILPVIILLPYYLKKSFEEKKWILIASFSFFIIYSIFYVAARNLGWLENIYVLSICSILLLVSAFLVCKEILQGLRNKNSDGYPIPYGPSLVVAAFIVIICLPLT